MAARKASTITLRKTNAMNIKQIVRLLPILFFSIFAEERHEEYTVPREIRTHWKNIDDLMHNSRNITQAQNEFEILQKNNPEGLNRIDNIKRLLFQLNQLDYTEEHTLLKCYDLISKELAKAPLQDKALLHIFAAQVLFDRTIDPDTSNTSIGTMINISQADTGRQERHQRALQHVASAIKLLPALDSLPSARYHELTFKTSKATDDFRFRPSLMDFLGNYLISVLQKEAHFTNRENYILTDSLFLTIEESDKLSSSECLIQLYKLFITNKRENRDVALWHTLERVTFFAGKRAYSNKTIRKQLITTYNTLYQQQKEHPLSSEILYRTASLLHQIRAKDFHQDQLSRLLTVCPPPANNITDRSTTSLLPLIVALCDSAISQHPNSIGANHCRQLKNSICTPSLQLGGSRYIAPEQSYGMNITYKNISRLQFKLYKAEEEFVRKLYSYEYERYKSSSISSVIKQYIAPLTPDSTWEVTLPEVTDLTEKRTQLGVKGLKTGSYIIVCSSPEEIVKGITYPASVHHALFSVTSLFAINKPVSKGSGKRVFYICDRKTGLPKKGVKVQPYRYLNVKMMDSLVLMGTQHVSDASGMVKLPYSSKSKTPPTLIRLSKGNDWLYLFEGFYGGGNTEKRTNISLQIFTDKKIYRPGQELYFKGIVTSNWTGERQLSPVVDTTFTVTLKDANRQPIDSLKVTTNRFGSVSGTFILPTNALNGQFSLSSKEMGSQYFRVEEYKKPTFYISIDTLSKPVLPGDKLTISGKVRAIAEYPLDSAQVLYTLSTNYPQHRDTVKGELYTDSDGSFSLPVQTKPLSDSSKSAGNLYYSFSCTVINREGESHTATENYTVGVNAFDLTLSHKRVFDIARETPSFTVDVRAYNNVSHDAAGELCIYSLHVPHRPITGNDEFQKSDNFIHSYDRKAFSHYFPYNEYKDESLEWKYRSKRLILRKRFHTAKERTILLRELKKQPPGTYRVTITKSGDKKEISYKREFQLIDTRRKRLPFPRLFWLYQDKYSCEPGKSVNLYFGSSVGSSSFMYELYKGDTLITQKVIRSGPVVNHIRIPIKESHRGGLTACITVVKEGILYKRRQQITVPWSNKELTVKLESFRSPLIPGNKDQWRIRISGAKNKKVESELLLSLYDASIDRLERHNRYHFEKTLGEHLWNFHTYEQQFAYNPWNKTREMSIPSYYSQWRAAGIYCPPHYDVSFFKMLDINSPYSARLRNNRSTWKKAKEIKRQCIVMADNSAQDHAFGATVSDETTPPNTIPPKKNSTKAKSIEKVDNTPIKVRQNFQETALFLPHLTCDKNGDIIVDVTMPDAITKWRLLGLAHTSSLEQGSLNSELFTRKKLMVTPNVPRYVREGDTILYSATIKNLSHSTIEGKTRLQIFNAITMESVISLFPAIDTVDSFSTTKGSSSLKQWRLAIPETTFPLIIRITANGGKFSDAEERIIPVLKRKRLVTESLPITVKANSIKRQTFAKFHESFSDSNIQQQKLTFEYTGKPIWNVVKALPYIAKEENSSIIATFHNYYANKLASHITKQNPHIEEVFKLWENDSTALLSRLATNDELKELILNQTPWVADAESEQREQQEISNLFNRFRIKSATKKSLDELKKNQRALGSGAFSWFPAGKADYHTTQYILTGFAHLKSLGVYDKRIPGEERQMIKKALDLLDHFYLKKYRELKRSNIDKKSRRISRETLHYLYCRGQFQEFPLSLELQEAISYYLEQTIDFQLEFSRFTQTLGALALWSFGQKESAEAIVKVIHHKSVLDTLSGGRYWKEDLLWNEHPIESHALLIEAYSTILNDTTSVRELKNWLLKEKQCNKWNSKRAAAEASYAMLLKGDNWIADSATPQITIGNSILELNEIPKQAGSNYLKKSWKNNLLKPEMANITIQNSGKHPAWGALYWSYFCDIDKISATQAGLQISKNHIRKADSNKTGNSVYTIGERFTVRLTITTDRTMKYVHIRDTRAAAFEPIETTSGRRWHGSLSYYKEINNASVDFFIPLLKKGTHTFEYELVVSQRGVFNDGIAEVQCLYAPEFKAHTPGKVIAIKEE